MTRVPGLVRVLDSGEDRGADDLLICYGCDPRVPASL
jgi:hypothetical protein